MAKDNFIKEFLFRQKKKLKAKLAKFQRLIQRSLIPKQIITSENCFQVPIIINNRNRYTFLKQMIEQLISFGYTNIYVLDNDSSYKPLIEYYKIIPAKVIYLKQNLGYRALWKSEIFNQFKKQYYVYSDPDILMQKDCPRDFVYVLFRTLIKYSFKEKVGVALKIDDLPDYYENKQEAIKNESFYWQKELEKDVYDAPVDTTLALYKPLAYGSAEESEALRVGGLLSAHHLTWYQDSSNLSEEEIYYKNTLQKFSSYYSSK
jgi:hypothetical protein